MTGTERRLRELEKEVAKLKAECNECRPTNYDIAKERHKNYWEQVKKPSDSTGIYNQCMEIAKGAFKRK